MSWRRPNGRPRKLPPRDPDAGRPWASEAAGVVACIVDEVLPALFARRIDEHEVVGRLVDLRALTVAMNDGSMELDEFRRMWRSARAIWRGEDGEVEA